MKKIFAFTLILSVHFSANSSTYEEPPNACYQGCSAWMENLLERFTNQGEAISMTPAVYTGECRIHSPAYDGDRAHYAVVMIDDHTSPAQSYFSTQMSFFSETNPFADWNLAKARGEMSPYWQEHGFFKTGNSATKRVEILYDSGDPAYLYFLRQDPADQSLLMISYLGTEMISFCDLKKIISSN